VATPVRQLKYFGQHGLPWGGVSTQVPPTEWIYSTTTSSEQSRGRTYS